MTASYVHSFTVTVELADGQTLEFSPLAGSAGEKLLAHAIGAPLEWAGIIQPLAGGARLEACVRNHGHTAIRIWTARIHFEPILQPESPDWRVFLDAGECAWSGVKRLADLSWAPPFDLFAGQRQKEPGDRDGSFQRSSLQIALFEASQRQAWLWGFLRQRHGYNGIDAFPDVQDPQKLRGVTAWQMLEILLEPGGEICLDPLVWLQGDDPLEQLERYAQLVQEHHGRQFDEPPVVGMMTWYGYRTAIDRDIVLRNADLVAGLFDGYPQPMHRLMLLDHGWQPDANWGYWEQADPQRFPEGMRWLADELRQRGLDLALWYTPFCITETSPNLKEIQPLLARDADGQPETSFACVWGQLPGHTSSLWPIHFFDGASDQVQEKWRREIQRMANQWGCIYWKLDFFGLFSGKERRLAYPAGELYARTYATFRQAAGEAAHLAPCSCDTNIQLGYNNSIRIAADIGNAGTWPKEMEAYTRGLSTIASLWYKHRHFWVNDADSIQVGCGCGLNEARVRATAVAFSGGHLMVSEDLRYLSPERIEIIRRLLPAFGHAARPLDLFEHLAPEEFPRIWQLPVKSDWGSYQALALFNLTQDVLQVTVLPEWLGLTAGETFGAVEWWQQRWLGKFDGPFEVIIPPADVAVVHAQAYRAYPWLVSVSHHFTGGWIVENLHFDISHQQLRGELVTRPGIALSLVGTLPPGYSIPASADYHGRGNGAGGWAHEILTTSQRTPFTIQFALEK